MALHKFPGLDPNRLLTYLAAVGLGKVIAKQFDKSCEIGWGDQGFRLRTVADLDIADALVDHYRPTPVVSPWNGGSGFQPQDKNQSKILDQIVGAGPERFEDFAESITQARKIMQGDGPSGAWDAGRIKKGKGALVQELRNELPDRALEWLDAAVVLRLDQDMPTFPILLGTGGNDGRLDFSANFHQRLRNVLPELGADREKSRGWVHDLLTGESTTAQVRGAVGMFDPLSAGGPESSTTGASDAVVNPWAFVLMIEGLTAFASGASRRFGSTRSRAAMPFMVDAGDGSGLAGAPGENTRGEFWAPIVSLTPWRSFTYLLREARASWDGATATASVHMYGAVRTFGVARGIDRFHRFVFAELNGLAYAAILRDRVDVYRDAGAGVMAGPLRAGEVFKAAGGGRVERAHDAFVASTTRFIAAPTVAGLIASLAALTSLEMAATMSEGGRERIGHRWLSRPAAGDFIKWLAQQPRDAVPPEIVLAASLASGVALRQHNPGTVSMRELILWSRTDGAWRPPRVTGLGARPLVDLLADLGVWLAHHQPIDRGRVERGFIPMMYHRLRPPTEVVHAWVMGFLDDALVEEALRAMVALDWRDVRTIQTLTCRDTPAVASPPLAFIRAFTSMRVTMPGQPPTSTARMRGMDQDWMTRLRAGQVGEVVEEARSLLRRHRVLDRVGERAGYPIYQHRMVRLGPGRYAATSDPAVGKRLIAATLAGSGWSDLNRVTTVAALTDA